MHSNSDGDLNAYFQRPALSHIAPVTAYTRKYQPTDKSLFSTQVHNPNVDPILATQECQAGCTQGDGSVAQTSAYGVCLQDCIDLYNVVSTVGGSATTATSGVAGSSASGSASGSTAAATTSIASSSVSVPAGLSGSVTASNAIASATATGSAAGAVRVGMTGLGLFGLLIVFFM